MKFKQLIQETAKKVIEVLCETCTFHSTVIVTEDTHGEITIECPVCKLPVTIGLTDDK